MAGLPMRRILFNIGINRFSVQFSLLFRWSIERRNPVSRAVCSVINPWPFLVALMDCKSGWLWWFLEAWLWSIFGCWSDASVVVGGRFIHPYCWVSHFSWVPLTSGLQGLFFGLPGWQFLFSVTDLLSSHWRQAVYCFCCGGVPIMVYYGTIIACSCATFKVIFRYFP